MDFKLNIVFMDNKVWIDVIKVLFILKEIL